MNTKTRPPAGLLPPTPPGEVLLEEFIKPLELTQKQVAGAVGIPAPRLTQLIKGDYRVSGELAIKLSALFGTSARFWINLQAQYDLELAERELGPQLRQSIAPLHCAGQEIRAAACAPAKPLAKARRKTSIRRPIAAKKLSARPPRG